MAYIFRNFGVFCQNQMIDSLDFILVDCTWRIGFWGRNLRKNGNSGSIFAGFLDSLAPIVVFFCFGNLSVSIIWPPCAWGGPLSQRHSVWWGSSVIFGFVFPFAFSLAFAGSSSFGMISCLRMAVRIGFALAFSLSLVLALFLTLSTVFTFGGMSCVVRRVRALAIPRLVRSIWPGTFSWTIPRSPGVQVGISSAGLLRFRRCASSTSNWRSFGCFWPPLFLGLGLGMSTWSFSGLALGSSAASFSRLGSRPMFVATTSARSRARSFWTLSIRRVGPQLLSLGRGSCRTSLYALVSLLRIWSYLWVGYRIENNLCRRAHRQVRLSYWDHLAHRLTLLTRLQSWLHWWHRHSLHRLHLPHACHLLHGLHLTHGRHSLERLHLLPGLHGTPDFVVAAPQRNYE